MGWNGTDLGCLEWCIHMGYFLIWQNSGIASLDWDFKSSSTKDSMASGRQHT